MELRIQPGPVEPTVLRLQASHRSQDVWDGVELTPDRLREHMATLADVAVDDRVLHYVRLAGFYGVHRLVSKLSLNRPLISALVERWRQETHTFHLPVGEATVTLQDVEVLAALRVDGMAVSGTSNYYWVEEVERMLGVRPEPKRDITGSSLKLTWIREHFTQLPPDADDLTVQRHARAYILRLMGASLFVDHSGNDIQLLYMPLLDTFEGASQYSWGSAMLAFLYRQLCRATVRGHHEIGGFLLLLQLWSWEHIHIGRPDVVLPPPEAQHDGADPPHLLGPQHERGVDPLGRRWLFVPHRRVDSAVGLGYYRDALDRQSHDQMTWQPYTADVLQALPPICREAPHIWRTKSALICFDIVELHLPDRVLRQFGLQQPVPPHCDTSTSLHKIDRRGKPSQDWRRKHEHYIGQWAQRAALVVSGDPASGSGVVDAYYPWYRRITRLFISPSFLPPTTQYQPTAFSLHMAASALHQIHQRATDMLSQPRDPSADNQAWSSLATFCQDVLRRVGDQHLLTMPSPDAATSASSTSLASSTLHNQPLRQTPAPRAPRRRTGPQPQLERPPVPRPQLERPLVPRPHPQRPPVPQPHPQRPPMPQPDPHRPPLSPPQPQRPPVSQPLPLTPPVPQPQPQTQPLRAPSTDPHPQTPSFPHLDSVTADTPHTSSSTTTSPSTPQTSTPQTILTQRPLTPPPIHRTYERGRKRRITQLDSIGEEQT